MSAYYNEIDPFAAQWLSNLIREGEIAPGIVDTRSIEDVRPSDLAGFTQCHFFAGIGGWSYALRLAGWPDSRAVWTGSCPCQPFSTAGKGVGFDDERHLWPAFHYLITQREPPIVFGEQVANALPWLDLVLADLEALGYSCGAFNIPGAAVGARHERKRLWFVADSNETGRENSKRITTPETFGEKRLTSGVVYSEEALSIRGTFEPDSSWIVDGIFGEGLAVSALGNAIVPQVAAQVIRSYMEYRA